MLNNPRGFFNTILLLVCPNPQLSPSTPEVDPTQLLPQLLDQLTALGDLARQLSHALGGNGHRPGQARELIEKLVKEGQ